MADNQENPPKRTKYEWGSLGRDGVRAAMEITMEEWSSMEADGGIAMLPEGAGQRAINQLGSPVHVHCCPTGTTEFLSLGSNGNEEPPTGPVQATLSALTQRMSQHAPKFLILCGSLRKESYTRKLAVEVGRILAGFGAEVKLFDPEGLPLFSEDVDTQSNPKVTELRMLTRWCEGMVWISPEIHGNYAGVFKNQVDWMPLSHGGQRPTQGKTVAVMQVEGGSQSFNVVNNLRVLGRWMRCVVIPNQSSIPQVQKYFAPDGTMVDSPYRDRVVDVVEELYKFTLLLRDQQPYLLCRYGEQK